MGVLGIISLVSVLVNLIGVAAGVGTSVVQSKQNKELTEKTNETNLQIAQEANAAQAAENEKAYERSKAGNQVGLLMQAGMSRAGAINSLNNGGSYTPAPINTAQMQAPQNDYSGVQQALSGLNGIMSNTGQFASMQKQIAMQEQKNKADIEYVNAQTAATESQTAQTNYSFAMQQLTDDMRKQAASISQRVSASDYDTPESYISALKSKCSSTEQKLFDSPQFVQALNATHQLNQTATSTAAGIRNTDASTANMDKDTEFKEVQIKKTQAEIRKLGVDVELERIQKLIAQVDYHYKSDTVQYKIRAEKAKDLRDVAVSTLEKMRSDDYKRAYESLTPEMRDVMNAYKLFCEYYSELDPHTVSDPDFKFDWRKMGKYKRLLEPTVLLN